MAQITKIAAPSMSSVLAHPSANKISGLMAGEAITVGAACYIKSDGKIWLSDGTSANAAAKVDGWAGTTAAAGEPLTLIFNVNVEYGTGLTPGASYFVSAATPGGIADAATTGGTTRVAFAIDATRVRLLQSTY